MKKYLIKEAKAGMSEGGIGCGPVCGPVVAEVKVKDEAGAEFYVTLAEVDGIPNFYKTSDSSYAYHTGDMDGKLSEKQIMEYFQELNKTGFLEYMDYEEVFADKDDNDLFDLFRYLIYLVRCSDGEESSFIQKTVGKYVDEIDIPISDIEEEYLEEDE